MMIIYKITNILNGKIYIGKTIQSLIKRWNNHCSKSSGCTALSNAIKKYGKENFTIEQIDYAFDPVELASKEAYLITKLNSMYPIGYNLIDETNGKGHSKRSIRKISNSKSTNSIKCLSNDLIYKSATLASKKLGICRRLINDNVLGNINSANGLVFEFVDITRKEKALNNTKIRLINRQAAMKKRQRKIVCLENMQVYNSIKIASEKLGISKSGIGEVLRGTSNKVGMYSFRYAIESLNIKRQEMRLTIDNNKLLGKIKAIKKTSKNIKCIELNINFPSIKEASRHLKVHHNSIRNVLSKRVKTAGGYTFVYTHQ